MPTVTVNEKDYPREIAEKVIDAILAKGRNAEVTYDDGARWLYRPEGRAIKINDM